MNKDSKDNVNSDVLRTTILSLIEEEKNNTLINESNTSEILLNSNIRFDILSNLDLSIVILRCGLLNGIPKSDNEISQILNITPEQIMFRFAMAIRKLKHPERIDRVKDYLD